MTSASLMRRGFGAAPPSSGAASALAFDLAFTFVAAAPSALALGAAFTLAAALALGAVLALAAAFALGGATTSSTLASAAAAVVLAFLVGTEHLEFSAGE